MASRYVVRMPHGKSEHNVDQFAAHHGRNAQCESENKRRFVPLLSLTICHSQGEMRRWV